MHKLLILSLLIGCPALLAQRLPAGGEPRGHEFVAQSFVDADRVAGGIAHFKGLLQHDAANAHAALAMLWNAAGRADSALAHGLRAVLGGAAIFPACEITVHLARADSGEISLREKLQDRLRKHPADLATAYTLAYEAFADGRLVEARQQLDALQKQYPRDWRLFHLRALIESEYLSIDAVLSSIQRGLSYAQAARDKEGMACMLFRQACCHLMRNDAAKAAAPLKKLEAMSAESEKISKFFALANAIRSQVLGDVHPAISAFKKLREQAMRQHDGITASRTSLALGRTYFQADNFSAAEQAILLAKAIADSLRFSTLQVGEEAYLGYARERLGLYDFAMRHYVSAETQAQRIGALYYLPYIWSGLARLSLHNQKYDEAIAFRKKQLALSGAIGRREMEMDCLIELARVYQFKTEYDSVEQVLAMASKLLRTYQTPRDLFNFKLFQGDFARRKGNFDQARKAYEEARGIADKVGTQATAAICLKIGDLLLKSGDCDGAVQAYRQAYHAVLDRVRAEGLRKGQLDLATSSEAIISLAKGLVHCGRSREGFEMAKQSRLLLLRALDAAHDRARHAGGDQELALNRQIDSLKAVMAKLADGHPVAERQRMNAKNKIDILAQRLGNLRMQNGSEADSLWLHRLSSNPYPLSVLQKSLAEQNAVALVYLVGANTALAFALHPDTLLARVVPAFNQTSLRAVVKRLNPLLVFDWNRPRSEALKSRLQLDLDRDAARELVEAFVNPLLMDRQPEKLIIIPDDVLCNLPFDALLRTARGSGVRLDLLPRIQIGLDFQDIFAQAHHDSARALIMANSQPVEASGENEKLPPLKFAVREAKKIAGRLDRSADLLINEYATRDSFLVKAGRYDILHLAMHASLSDWSPEYARFFFGAASGGSEPLYGYEISQLRLRARLAVLSSCNTALGNFRPGLGLQSLVLAFADAEVPSVVATLWQVDEETTEKLMIEFYEQLRRGKNFSQALAGAKQHLIEDGYSDPYYWAGFVLYGKDGSVNFEASPFAAIALLWPLVIVLMLVGVALWVGRRKRQTTFVNRA